MKFTMEDLTSELVESCVQVIFDWDEIEESAPRYGGVYIMTDGDNHVVYVMKTRNFREQLLDHWEKRMWEEVDDVYCLRVTGMDVEQLYHKLVDAYQSVFNAP